ncbi:MAG: hypothetical protein Q4D96_14625, partial [Propionibacteriaceae bacterium]|nr:hypothetical protein [Propionibacteriaceae bacterium]
EMADATNVMMLGDLTIDPNTETIAQAETELQTEAPETPESELEEIQVEEPEAEHDEAPHEPEQDQDEQAEHDREEHGEDALVGMAAVAGAVTLGALAASDSEAEEHGTDEHEDAESEQVEAEHIADDQDEEIEETIVYDEMADATNVMMLGDLTIDPDAETIAQAETELETQAPQDSEPSAELDELDQAEDAEEAVGEVPPVLWDTAAEPLQPAIEAPTPELTPAALEAPVEVAEQVEQAEDHVEPTVEETAQEAEPKTESEPKIEPEPEPFAGNDDDTLHFDDEDDVETTNVFDGLRDETVFLEDSFNSPTYAGQDYTGPSYDMVAADPVAGSSSLLDDETETVPLDDEIELSYAPARAAVDSSWGRSGEESHDDEGADDEPPATPSRACDKDEVNHDVEDTREIRLDRPASGGAVGGLSHSQEMNFWEFLAAEDEAREYGQLHDDSIDPSRPNE